MAEYAVAPDGMKPEDFIQAIAERRITEAHPLQLRAAGVLLPYIDVQLNQDVAAVKSVLDRLARIALGHDIDGTPLELRAARIILANRAVRRNNASQKTRRQHKANKMMAGEGRFLALVPTVGKKTA